MAYVPERPSGPYRAKAGERGYRKPCGSSFYLLEHVDPEGMFGRRPKPQLAFHKAFVGSDPDAGIVVGLRNDGKGCDKALLGLSAYRPA